MKPTIIVRKNDSPYEIISKAKSALRSAKKNQLAAVISLEASKFKSTDKIKNYLSKYIIIREEDSV